MWFQWPFVMLHFKFSENRILLAYVIPIKFCTPPFYISLGSDQAGNIDTNYKKLPGY